MRNKRRGEDMPSSGGGAPAGRGAEYAEPLDDIPVVAALKQSDHGVKIDSEDGSQVILKGYHINASGLCSSEVWVTLASSLHNRVPALPEQRECVAKFQSQARVRKGAPFSLLIGGSGFGEQPILLNLGAVASIWKLGGESGLAR